MNKSNINKNFNNPKNESLDWKLVQDQMKSKLGLDIYESWLKKLILLRKLTTIYYCRYRQDLLEIGLLQDI